MAKSSPDNFSSSPLLNFHSLIKKIGPELLRGDPWSVFLFFEWEVNKESFKNLRRGALGQFPLFVEQKFTIEVLKNLPGWPLTNFISFEYVFF